MAISQSLYTGVSGLSTNSDGMSVIANNIANANAKGFKRDRANFEDLVSASMAGATGPQAKIGRGARLGGVDTIHTQGGVQVTDNLTDIAIQGKGFFVVAGSKDNESAGRLYSRVGNLHFDKDGYFATTSGGHIQGYLADNKGRLSSNLTDIRLETNAIAPKATENLTLNVQMDSRADILKEPFDAKRPQDTSNFNSSVSIFDSHGHSHQATLFMRKIGSDDTGVQWEYNAVVNNKEVTNPDEGEYKLIGTGQIKFDKNGALLEKIPGFSSVSFADGANPNQTINFDFGKSIAEGGNGINASTSIAGKSTTVFHQQDGYEAGQLKSLEIGLDGIVKGVFTNGIEKTLAGIALATFPNENGLMKQGQNLFSANLEAGPANIGLPQTGARGGLFASALEESNVDLANEFVNMITTQRLFQANSRSITTTDSMIEEILNLKR